MNQSIKRLLSLNLATIMALTLSVTPTYAAHEEREELCAMESGCADEAVFAKDIAPDVEEVPQEQEIAPALLSTEAVLSSVSGYSISVGNARFLSDQAASGSGWAFSPNDHSLTLNSYNGGTISASGDLVIYTNGTCKITGSSGKYGGSALAASGNLDIYVQGGKLSVTAGSGSVSGGDAVSVSGILYCRCDGTASFTGGASTGTQYRGGDALYARNAVNLSGSGITATGGSASTSSAYGLSGGCAIYSSKVNIYADCTLRGGTGYIGGPAVYFDSYCQFGIVSASVSSGKAGTYAIVNPNSLNWYYHLHTTPAGTNDSFTISVNRYTLWLDGNGGRTWSGATFTSLREYYPASYDLDYYHFTRSGYTQVAWTTASGELIPYDSRFLPEKDTTLYAKWVTTGANDILLNGLQGMFSDGTFFRKTNGTSVKLPDTLSYNGKSEKVLAWGDTTVVSSGNLHLYENNVFYAGNDVVAPNANAATVLYAWENDGLFACYHAGLGQFQQGGSILLQGESSRTVASATSLTTYVPDDSYLIAPENYEFSGWSLYENAITADYLPGNRITLHKNVTDFYAVWTPTQLTGELTDGVTLTQILKENRMVVSVSKQWCQSNGVQNVICALYDGGKFVRAASKYASGGEITLTLPYEFGNNHTLKLFALDGTMCPTCECLSCVPENLW